MIPSPSKTHVYTNHWKLYNKEHRVPLPKGALLSSTVSVQHPPLVEDWAPERVAMAGVCLQGPAKLHHGPGLAVLAGPGAQLPA